MVMKSAEDGHRCNAAYVLDDEMDRSVFAKRLMSPQLISPVLRVVLLAGPCTLLAVVDHSDRSLACGNPPNDA
jgi:hypothetical protein